MSAPRLLIDNDILVLLSCSGLLDDAIGALGLDRPSAFHLDTLPYVMERKPSLQQLSEKQKSLIRAACRDLPAIVEQPSVATQESLARARNIDPGEVVLFGLASEDSSYLVTSGDKAAMRALATDPTLSDICHSLAGRIICLETLCLELIRVRGASQVAEAFTPFIPSHIGLTTYFGAIDKSGEAGCYAAISHYLVSLTRQLGNGLLWSR